MTKEFWIISDSEYKKVMPQAKRAATYVELAPNDVAIPRLYKRRQDAQLSLEWWLQGRWISGYDGDVRNFPVPERTKTPPVIRKVTLNYDPTS